MRKEKDHDVDRISRFLVDALGGGRTGDCCGVAACHAVAPAPRSRGYQPLETLEERFARGEIDGEEFNLRRVELTKT